MILKTLLHNYFVFLAAITTVKSYYNLPCPSMPSSLSCFERENIYQRKKTGRCKYGTLDCSRNVFYYEKIDE